MKNYIVDVSIDVLGFRYARYLVLANSAEEAADKLTGIKSIINVLSTTELAGPYLVDIFN